MKPAIFLSFFCIGNIAQATAPPDPIHSRTVTTREGSVRGIQVHKAVDAFLGVPYAQPPVASLRFEPPRLPLKRTGVFNATIFGPVCHQFHYKTILGDAIVETSGQSEDCLSLNVFVPRQAPSKQRKLMPVFVWSYGGAFGEGGGSMPLFNPTQFVAENKDIIVVTWKYVPMVRDIKRHSNK
jgi:carboxylesterase type B